MANIAFKKGLLQNLPSTYAEGTFYVTTDERAIYLDVDSSTRIRLGDFQEFASLEALQANSNPSTTALYYISGLNILAKWNGTEYVQINKDTGATSFEVVGDGNAITDVSYDATTRKLTLTKGATFMKEADVDSKISTAVGTLGNDADGNAYANVKAYVDAKTADIASDAALGELQTKVETNEDAIKALQDANAEGGAVATAIADAKAAADNAQDEIDALEALVGETAVETQISTAIDAALKVDGADKYALATEVDSLSSTVGQHSTKLNSLSAQIGSVNTRISSLEDAESDIISDINGLDVQISGLTTHTIPQLQEEIDANTAGIDAIKNDYLTSADKEELQDNISAEEQARKDADDAQVARITILEGQITGLSGAMHFKGVVEVDPATVTEGYENGDVVVYGEKEYVWNNGAFVEFGDVSAEGERIAELEGIVGKPAEGETAATGLVKDVADNAAAIAAEKARAEAKEAELVAADATNLQAAKDYANDVVEALGIDDYVKNADADATYAVIGHDHDDKYDAIGSADQALADAIAAAKTETENQVKALADGQVKTNTEAITTKAAQSDLDSAVERIGTAEGKISALEEASATHALKTEVEAVQTALDEYEAANDAVVAGKADKATTLAGYGITDAMTATEIEALVSWGSF